MHCCCGHGEPRVLLVPEAFGVEVDDVRLDVPGQQSRVLQQGRKEREVEVTCEDVVMFRVVPCAAPVAVLLVVPASTVSVLHVAQ